ncbi:Translation initiation factor 6 [uncultured archaeon]|nr:Translation initiation factor 6 [uncultured archaeon]
MNFSKGTVRGSPYVGVFCSATDDYALVPFSVQPKELRLVEEKLEASAIRASIGNSGLLGVLAKGIGNKFAVSSLADRNEVKALEKEGLEVLAVQENYTATGNLMALNKSGAIASPLFSEKAVTALGKFFGTKIEQMAIGGNELSGACVTVTNKGLIANPNISESEFERLETLFRVRGMATTANFGDLMVGNSIVANSKGAIVGEKTSGSELSRIDEGLRGD